MLRIVQNVSNSVKCVFNWINTSVYPRVRIIKSKASKASKIPIDLSQNQITFTTNQNASYEIHQLLQSTTYRFHSLPTSNSKYDRFNAAHNKLN